MELREENVFRSASAFFTTRKKLQSYRKASFFISIREIFFFHIKVFSSGKLKKSCLCKSETGIKYP